MKLARKGFKNTPIQKKISAFANFLVQHPCRIELPLKHRFTPGLYSREMFAPAGSVVISKVHLTESQFVMSQGSMLLYDEKKNAWKRVDAPCAGVTKAGTRRVAYVLEDMIFTTFHATRKTKIEEIEKELAFNPPEMEGKLLCQ